jgi:hypothetical protein
LTPKIKTLSGAVNANRGEHQYRHVGARCGDPIGGTMATRTFKAKIRLKSGIQEVTVQADNYFKAKEMLEAQYGKGSIFVGPTEKR